MRLGLTARKKPVLTTCHAMTSASNGSYDSNNGLLRISAHCGVCVAMGESGVINDFVNHV